MLRRPPVSTLSDTLFPYTSLFRSIQLRQPLESGTTIDFIRIVNLAEIQPGSVLSLSPSSPAFFSLGTPRQATLTLIPPPWQPSNKVRSSKPIGRSEEHTSELQSLMRISYAVFCLKKKKHNQIPSLITSRLYSLLTYVTMKSNILLQI